MSPDQSLAQLQHRLGLVIDSALLRQALTHRSYAYEQGGLPTNERLEFLGDSVLGLVVTDTLYCRYPQFPEGQLAKLRSAVVNMRALADVGRELELGSYLFLGRGEEITGGRDKSSILADTVEAVIGAAYLDSGASAAQDLVLRLIDPVLLRAVELGAGLDWKTSLQEISSESGIGVPEYVLSGTGPDHEKTFTAVVEIGGESLGSGVGRSKKEAEQRAAEQAWECLRQRYPAASED